MQRVLLACSFEHPAELDELPGRQVGGQRFQERVAVEREPHHGPEAEQLGHHGAHDRLLAQAACDVAVGRVELVLPDARIDERALPVHVLQAFVESVAVPARTA